MTQLEDEEEELEVNSPLPLSGARVGSSSTVPQVTKLERTTAVDSNVKVIFSRELMLPDILFFGKQNIWDCVDSIYYIIGSAHAV